LVKAGFRVVGSGGFIEGVALVGTGASFTMLDRGLLAILVLSMLGGGLGLWLLMVMRMS